MLFQTYVHVPLSGRLAGTFTDGVQAGYTYSPSGGALETTEFDRHEDPVLRRTRSMDGFNRLSSIVTAGASINERYGCRYDTQGLGDRVTREDETFWNYSCSIMVVTKADGAGESPANFAGRFPR